MAPRTAFKKGHPKVGGRKKGRQNNLPTEVKQRFQRLLGQEITFTPLQVMHAVMLTRIEHGDWDGALLAAEKAAPYSHAKLNATDVRVQHSVADKSDAAVAAEIETLRAKIQRAQSAPPVMIESTVAESVPVDVGPKRSLNVDGT